MKRLSVLEGQETKVNMGRKILNIFLWALYITSLYALGFGMTLLILMIVGVN